jgi:hypothetical protein
MSRLSGLFSSVFAWKDWGETSKSIIKNNEFPAETNLGTPECASGINSLCLEGRVNWRLLNLFGNS